MPLSAPNLDDLRFQSDLVDEARRRIIRYCPEWTDYNLSDPGITLIELFAWMTEMMVYRLNQVPEKNYVKFMELLGMQLQSASSARADLTFWLSAALPLSLDSEETVVVPQGTEAVTQVIGDGEEVIFTTDRSRTIVPPKLSEVRRQAEFHKNYLSRMGIEVFPTFSHPAAPQAGDTFYLGFEENRNISGHILQLEFTCEPTQAVGVKREDPPWVWECSLGNDLWQEITPSTRLGERDTTGGLNNTQGQVTLYLPLELKTGLVNGRNAYWVRCRLEQRRQEQGIYTVSPRVTNIVARTLGATVPATHAVVVENEILGQSDGEPGQTFTLQHYPLLALQAGETIEVEEKQYGEVAFVPWQQVADFSQSERYDRHFRLDTATGQLTFGPAIRQPDGSVKQYGRIPQAGMLGRVTRYRHGGGVKGNVPLESIQTLTTSLAYIARVSNLRRAAGGRDAEGMDELKVRAQRELRAQLRAVTPEDYEDLALQATRAVARVKCNIPQDSGGRLPPGVVEILIVPAVADSLKVNDRSKLYVDETLLRVVHNHLDKYRLLTTTLQLREPNYLGIKVSAEIVPSEFSTPEIVKGRVNEALKAFLSPLDIVGNGEARDDLMDGKWVGWPFGRNLFVAEIYSLIQRVAGVKHVLDVQLSQRPVIPREELSLDSEDEGAVEGQPMEEEATPIKEKVLRVKTDTLLCSLAHDIKITRLSDIEGGGA